MRFPPRWHLSTPREIVLTIPQESGAGGSSLWRLADENHAAWLEGTPEGNVGG